MANSTNSSSDSHLYHVGLSVCHHLDGDSERSIVCARVVVLSVLVILTLVFCIVKLVLFALTPNPDRMRVGLFCLSTLECIFLTVKWTVATDIQLHFVALFLHVSAYLLLCCYYGRLAMRVRHKEDLARQLIVPIAICVECFFFFTLIYSLLTIVSDSSECRRPHWLLLSTSQVVLAGVFIVAGVFLHKRLSSIGQSAKELILSRKVTLWTLITAFGLSAVVQFANDLILQTSSTADCDRTYGSPGSAGYTAAILIVRIIGQLFPIWMLIFFLSSGHKHRGLSESTTAPQVHTFQESQDSNTRSTNSVATQQSGLTTLLLPSTYEFDYDSNEEDENI